MNLHIGFVKRRDVLSYGRRPANCSVGAHHARLPKRYHLSLLIHLHIGAAADQVGCGRVEELTHQAPLVLPPVGAVTVQVVMGAPGTAGARPLTIHSRADDATDWTLHVSGTVAPAAREPDFDLTAWPPADASPLPVEGFYEELRQRGYVYGPIFRALRRAWRDGDHVYAEVELPSSGDGQEYRLHPALLDAAMHADQLDENGGAAEGGTLLPFSWSGVTLHAAGATSLRVHLERLRGDELCAMRLADAAGKPVATVEQMAVRPVSAAQWERGTGRVEDLYRLDWSPVALPDVVPAGAAVHHR
jgi:acyl transferase domain-containing protein